MNVAEEAHREGHRIRHNAHGLTLSSVLCYAWRESSLLKCSPRFSQDIASCLTHVTTLNLPHTSHLFVSLQTPRYSGNQSIYCSAQLLLILQRKGLGL